MKTDVISTVLLEKTTRIPTKLVVLTTQSTKFTRTCVKPRIFVGVFTDSGGVATYARRRAALRAAWFPNTTDALERLECTYGVTLRFVIGRGAMTNDTEALRAWNEELITHGDFLKLDVLDEYPMTAKSAEMFRHVMHLPQTYEYVVKIDDDMFVSLDHLVKAVDQWADMKVDYVGCMSNPGTNVIYTTKGHKWYEPLHDILATHNHMFACGAMYALSRSAAMRAFTGKAESTRLFAVEDQAMGFWMLAHNVTHFDDRRLCASSCNSSHAFVGVNAGDYCNGLPDPLRQIPALNNLASCHVKPPVRLPFIDSKFQRFNEMIESYRQRNHCKY